MISYKIKNKKLTLEEQLELGRRISEGDQEAVSILFNANLKLVITIAKKYANPNSGLDMEDLIQEGNIGLYKAVQQYDYKKGFRFSTYASYWINQSIQKGIARNNHVIRITEVPMNFIRKMNAIMNEYIKSNAEEPSDEYLAEKMDCDTEKIKEMKKVMQSTLSIDKHYSSNSTNEDNNFSLLSSLTDENYNFEDDVIQNQMYELLYDIINNLDEKEAQIIIWKYGLDNQKPKTLQEMSDIIGLTRERVRQISLKAETKIRKALEEKEISFSDF